MFLKHHTLGLDLGQDSVKTAFVDAGRGVIENLMKCPVLVDRQSKEQMPERDHYAKCINELIKRSQKEKAGFKRSVAVSIPGGGSICGYLELPVLKPKELSVAVPSQAMKFIPHPMDKVTLSFIQVPQLSSGEKKSAVFFIAELNETLSYTKKLLAGCGLEINRIETYALALAREFGKDHGKTKERFFVLVNVGHKLTHVVILRDRYPYFAREFGIAGGEFTYAFQMGHQISWQEAESMKRSYDALTEDVSIEPFMTRWLNEVKKSITYFEKQFHIELGAIEKLILSGGTASMKNLDIRLARHTLIPVDVDAWEKLKSPLEGENHSCIYNVAVGLALE